MRFMIIIKASQDSEAGIMPSTELLTAMGNYNEELVKAGIMLAGEPERKARVHRIRDGIVIDRQTWQDIAVADARHYHGALNVFTPEAFQYFLPAFMLSTTVTPPAPCKDWKIFIQCGALYALR